ncbi:MAG: hypothetical protein IGR92_07650 [Leptolyngbyaceae cyanobacterium T60_A2020_046]|nr:hypothetical protein [Leptolyngbyaceae cyanobacterium T60_A2020_046]
MAPSKPDPETTLETLKLVIYLVPIFGFFPALWSRYRHQGSRREETVSRTAIALALAWLAVYCMAGTGAQVFEPAMPRLLVTSLLATTGYFLTNLWLMIRLLQGKSIKLPGITSLSDRLP